MASLNRDRQTRRLVAAILAEPILTRERELDLARAYATRGDRAAGAAIVRANLRHVLASALRYQRFGVPLADLIAQGSLGLQLALQRFEPERGLRFCTFAIHWVRSEQLRLLRCERSPIHSASRRQAPRADASSGKDPAALADRAPLGDEQLEAKRAQLQRVAAVRAATTDLSDRERFLLEHRLLADDEARLTLSEVGRAFGVSRERARQLESNVMAKLRSRLLALAEASTSAAA